MGRNDTVADLFHTTGIASEVIVTTNIKQLEKAVLADSICEQCGVEKAVAFVYFDDNKRLACRKCVDRFEALQRGQAQQQFASQCSI